MVNFGEAGRICLNREISGVCENCLWWEWDSTRQQCCNCQFHICPLYRENLFKAATQSRARDGGQLGHGPRPAEAGSATPPKEDGHSGTV